MAVAMQFVIGALTAVCTSLIIVLLLWRLSRLRRTPPPCCDVINLLTWLLDVSQAVMGAAILVLVVSDVVTCAVAGFLAVLAGALTLCLLATRSVVMATGSRDVDRCEDSGKVNNQRCTGVLCITPLLIVQVSMVTVFCALPLSQLPVASTTPPRNHTPYHLTCLPLALESRDTAAWSYSCFLLVAVGWLPLLVAMTTDVIHYSRDVYTAARRKQCRSMPVACLSTGALRLVLWTLVLALISAQVSRTSSVAEVQLVLVLSVDLAMLVHVVHDVLSVRHSYVTQLRHHHQQQNQLPARLTAVTRAQRQQVR